MQLHGIHHVTAITATAPANHRYYTQVLGMRLVKKTVNQDDVSAYHLFYADGLASPGTDLTFFDFPSPPERRGSDSIVCTGAARRRPRRPRILGRPPRQPGHPPRPDRRAGRPPATSISRTRRASASPSSTTQAPAPPTPGTAAPSRPNTRSAASGPSPSASATSPPPTASSPTCSFMRPVRTYEFEVAFVPATVQVYAMGEGGPAAELHVRHDPTLAPAQPGAGGVHHVAFRIPDADYEAWVARYQDLGVRSSGPVDRFYFRSLYAREPNGILFEIATDGPGFAVDEPMETLGQSLALPPFLPPSPAGTRSNEA